MVFGAMGLVYLVFVTELLSMQPVLFFVPI